MANELIGFPNQIEATLGSGWTGKHGLAPGASILQQKDASEDRWTEDGGNTANDLTNRLRFLPSVSSFSMGTSYWSVMRNVALAAADNDNWRNLGFWSAHDFLGGSPTGYALDYVFKDLWSGTPYGSANGGHNDGFFNESWVPYNDQVFLALEEYDPNTPPADVIGFAGSSDVYDTAQLSWLEPLGAETYTLERSPHGQNDWTTLASSATGTSHEDTGLAAGTRYDYRIRASNSFGDSDWSEPITLQTRGRLAGTVVMDAGDTPVEGVQVLVRDQLLQQDVAIVPSDVNGAFDLSVDPGMLAHVIASYQDGQGDWHNAPSLPGIAVAGVTPIHRRIAALGPIAFYPLTDAGTTARDVMGLQHGQWRFSESGDGGIIQQHVALIEDSSLRFPRLLGVTGAAVVVEHHEDLSFQCNTDEFTILFWVQTTVTSRGLLGKGRQSSGDYQLLVRLDNSPVGTLEVRLGSSTITFNSSATIHDGQPHAVAIRMRNEGGTQTASVWIDGVKDAESTSGIGSETNTHPWVLGGYWSSSNQQPESVMDGGLGLVAFFDRALTDSEIQSVGVTRNAEGV